MQARENILFTETDPVPPVVFEGVHPVALLYGYRICGQLVESPRSAILVSGNP
jgi:hypothetical protein